jgi:hypothetical protein
VGEKYIVGNSEGKVKIGRLFLLDWRTIKIDVKDSVYENVDEIHKTQTR